VYKRIVIKVGTNLITGEKGFKKDFLAKFAKQVCALHKKGKEIVIVSSGAIGCGRHDMKMHDRVLALPEKQAIAAIGQISLMKEYRELFAKKGITVAQVLLDHADVKHKDKNVNARNTLNQLLEWKSIPVINENDTVATAEIKFGDNDSLAGIVAGMIDADLLVILTSVDGVYDRNPHFFTDAKKMDTIENVESVIGSIDTAGKTALGTGGMATKLEIAASLNYAGIAVIIANGNDGRALEKAAKGEKSGTLIVKKGVKADAKKRWILLSLRSCGTITVDDGAKKALMATGKSLLAAGIKSVHGEFKFGDAVDIVDSNRKKIGKGIVNYSFRDAEKIAGKKTVDIREIMKENFYEEVIHRDNLFIFK
jgi:glutamate 5-kinase